MQTSAFVKLAMAALAMMPFSSAMSIPGGASVEKRTTQPACNGKAVTGWLKYPTNNGSTEYNWLSLGTGQDPHGNTVYSLYETSIGANTIQWTWCADSSHIYTAAVGNDGTTANIWPGQPFYLAAVNTSDSTGFGATLRALPAPDTLPADNQDTQYRVFRGSASHFNVFWTGSDRKSIEIIPLVSNTRSGFSLLPKDAFKATQHPLILSSTNHA